MGRTVNVQMSNFIFENVWSCPDTRPERVEACFKYLVSTSAGDGGGGWSTVYLHHTGGMVVLANFTICLAFADMQLVKVRGIHFPSATSGQDIDSPQTQAIVKILQLLHGRADDSLAEKVSKITFEAIPLLKPLGTYSSA